MVSQLMVHPSFYRGIFVFSYLHHIQKSAHRHASLRAESLYEKSI